MNPPPLTTRLEIRHEDELRRSLGVGLPGQEKLGVLAPEDDGSRRAGELNRRRAVFGTIEGAWEMGSEIWVTHANARGITSR